MKTFNHNKINYAILNLSFVTNKMACEGCVTLVLIQCLHICCKANSSISGLKMHVKFLLLLFININNVTPNGVSIAHINERLEISYNLLNPLWSTMPNGYSCNL